MAAILRLYRDLKVGRFVPRVLFFFGATVLGARPRRATPLRAERESRGGARLSGTVGKRKFKSKRLEMGRVSPQEIWTRRENNLSSNGTLQNVSFSVF
jgi:hypothetical protein